MSELKLELKRSSYEHNILIDEFSPRLFQKEILKYVRGSKVVVFISQKVDELYGRDFFPKDTNKVKFIKYIVPDGEKYKSLNLYSKFMRFMIKNKFTREDCVIAFGGGVIGDLAGFVASTYMRGVDFIQIPTTLLACIDSSIGGKNAVNFFREKNVIGTFYQPKVVIVNTYFLQTIGERQLKTGLGEVFKYALIEKSCLNNEYYDLLEFLRENKQNIFDFDPTTMISLIKMCIQLKISVVQQDEKEGGLRKILNLGHTFGHAIEHFYKFETYTHGEAIIEGMIIALDIAEKLQLIDREYKLYVLDIMLKYDFMPVVRPLLSKMIKIIEMDKKNTTKGIAFILPSGRGKVVIKKILPETFQDLLNRKSSY